MPNASGVPGHDLIAFASGDDDVVAEVLRLVVDRVDFATSVLLDQARLVAGVAVAALGVAARAVAVAVTVGVLAGGAVAALGA